MRKFIILLYLLLLIVPSFLLAQDITLTTGAPQDVGIGMVKLCFMKHWAGATRSKNSP